MFHYLCGQSYKTVSINHNFFKRKESRKGLNRGLSAYQHDALSLGHTGSHSPHYLLIELNVHSNLLWLIRDGWRGGEWGLRIKETLGFMSTETIQAY